MTATVAACWQVMVGLIYLAIPGFMLRLFAPPTENAAELVALGSAMLRISVAWQLFDAISMVVSEALRSAGDTKWCLWARLSVAWFLFVPLSYVVVDRSQGSAIAAILCIVVYLGSLAGLFLWRFRGGAWRRIDLTGAPDVLAT
jgi:MATE family multidrug resistance protein